MGPEPKHGLKSPNLQQVAEFLKDNCQDFQAAPQVKAQLEQIRSLREDQKYQLLVPLIFASSQGTGETRSLASDIILELGENVLPYLKAAIEQLRTQQPEEYFLADFAAKEGMELFEQIEMASGRAQPRQPLQAEEISAVLGSMGIYTDRELAHALTSLANLPDQNERQEQIVRAIPQLLSIISNSNNLRDGTLKIIASLPPELSIPALKSELEPNWADRRNPLSHRIPYHLNSGTSALLALSKIKPDEATEFIIDSLIHPNSIAYSFSPKSLQVIKQFIDLHLPDEIKGEVINQLNKVVAEGSNYSDSDKLATAMALTVLDPGNRAAIETVNQLAKSLHSTETPYRPSGQLDMNPRELLPWALGHLGKDAVISENLLLDLLRQQEAGSFSEYAGVWALGQIKSREALPVLEQILRSSFDQYKEPEDMEAQLPEWLRGQEKDKGDLRFTAAFSAIDKIDSNLANQLLEEFKQIDPNKTAIIISRPHRYE